MGKGVYPGEGEVFVWRCRAVPGTRFTLACLAAISGSERSQAASFRRSADSCGYAAAHGILRMALSLCLDISPAEIVLPRRENGKPVLDPSYGMRLGFSVSHSGDWAAVALSGSGETGVDIECVRRDFDWLPVARKAFSPEENRLLDKTAPDQRTAVFYRLWTLKEAYLKARGKGIDDLRDAWNIERILKPSGWTACELRSDGCAGAAVAICGAVFIDKGDAEYLVMNGG